MKGLTRSEAEREAARRHGKDSSRYHDFMVGWEHQWGAISSKWRTRTRCGKTPFGFGRKYWRGE